VLDIFLEETAVVTTEATTEDSSFPAKIFNT
jgi:hypothetical protein